VDGYILFAQNCFGSEGVEMVGGRDSARVS
jgi:hypothetical protein